MYDTIRFQGQLFENLNHLYALLNEYAVDSDALNLRQSL